MNDEQDNTPQDEEPRSGPLGGERLAAARRERQITVLEVAKELHLDEYKVRALEANDFDVLGAPVFAKGHLRKYAQLVGVDEADVLADYYAMTRSSALPPIVVGRARPRNEFSPGPWIALLAVLAVAAGAYWWFAKRDDAPQRRPQPEELQRERPQPELLRPEQIQPEELPPQTTEPEPSTEPPVSENREEPALEAGEIRLALSFSGECWTEIIDADGRRLFFNMGHAGNTTSLRGTAPISALFGNAQNVSVQLNGEDFPLPAPTSASGMVRVVIPDR